MPTADRLQLLLDKEDIRDLSIRYMRSLDRLDAGLQAGVFHADATTDYGFFVGSAPDFIVFAQDVLRSHAANQHFLGQMMIDVEGDVAFGEIYYIAYHRVADLGVSEDMVIAGRYVDRYERRGGVRKIAHRKELVDWGRREPAADGFLASLPGMLGGARGADDWSSRRGHFVWHDGKDGDEA